MYKYGNKYSIIETMNYIETIIDIFPPPFLFKKFTVAVFISSYQINFGTPKFHKKKKDID